MATELAQRQRTFVIGARSQELNDRAFDREILPQFFHLFQRRSLSDFDRVVLDLRTVAWGNPYGALGVVLLCQVLRDYSPWELEIRLSGRRRKRNTWLAHLGLPEAVAHLDRVTVTGQLEDEPRISRYRYLPITRLSPHQQTQALSAIAAQTQAVLVGDFHYDAVQAARFITALSELCTNIYDHSAPSGDVRGYLAMQAYKDAVKFAVMDLGVGIPRSLRPKYGFPDDGQALLKSLEPGVSSHEERGLGLARVREIVGRQRGILNIRSGRAKVLLLGRGGGRGREREGKGAVEQLVHVHVHEQGAAFPGTQIGILLRRVTEAPSPPRTKSRGKER